jgi:single-stranded-DNA-specific exonuclease
MTTLDSNSKKWKILHRTPNTDHGTQTVIDILLKNRGIKTKKQKDEFFNPTSPEKISLRNLGIKTDEVNKVIKRLRKAKDKKEKVIIFGDYDADGVCATAILWENLYGLKLDVLPYIPERFSEGYGLKVESVKKLKIKYEDLRLIITVDNGIVANEAVNKANKLGIDVIITDHHQKGKKIPNAYAIIHTTKIGGAGIAWILAREISSKLQASYKLQSSLELAAIGTIADQLPLIGPNRSFAKYGLAELNKTERIGLLALFKEAGIWKVSNRPDIGTREVGFVIAPRINAMGRLDHAIDSLRLLCTKSKKKATELSYLLGKTNVERQKIVKNVVAHAKKAAERMVAGPEGQGVMVIHHESYHEGVIGLAASKLVDTFYRPAIVFSKGKKYSKASARSIPGFDIIHVIRKFNDMLIDAGGHPMAAGFTLETKNLLKFSQKLDEISRPLLTKQILQKKQKIDLMLNFSQINQKLAKEILNFEPFGIGNFAPVFATFETSVLNARTVGMEGRHLKMTLEENGKVFDAIAFGLGDFFLKITPGALVDVVYNLEENVWNGRTSLQLKVKDIKLA